MKTFLEYIKPNRNKKFIYDSLTEEEQLAKVKVNGWDIQHISRPTEKVQKAAVLQNPWTVQLIENPPETIQELAVKGAGCSVMTIENPSKRIQILAVENNPQAILYVDNSDPDILIACVFAFPGVLDGWKSSSEHERMEKIFFNLSREVQGRILEKRPDLASRIRNLDPELAKQYKTSLQGGQVGFY